MAFWNRKKRSIESELTKLLIPELAEKFMGTVSPSPYDIEVRDYSYGYPVYLDGDDIRHGSIEYPTSGSLFFNTSACCAYPTYYNAHNWKTDRNGDFGRHSCDFCGSWVKHSEIKQGKCPNCGAPMDKAA